MQFTYNLKTMVTASWNAFSPRCIECRAASREKGVCPSVSLSVRLSDKRVYCDKAEENFCLDFYAIQKII